MENAKQSYKKRMQELKERGIDTSLLLSDWCVDCMYSIGIVERVVDVYDNIPLHVEFVGLCQTGCNGFPPFNIVRKKGKSVIEFIEGKTPLMYEKEGGVDVEI